LLRKLRAFLGHFVKGWNDGAFLEDLPSRLFYVNPEGGWITNAFFKNFFRFYRILRIFENFKDFDNLSFF